MFEFPFAGSGDCQVAKHLESFCKKEVYDIEMCSECYHRSNTQTDWFTEVCIPPHMLVWARESSYHPYKPAKVIGIDKTSTHKIDVRFFGGNHFMINIPPADCYIYSKENPNGKCDENTRMQLIGSFVVIHYVFFICSSLLFRYYFYNKIPFKLQELDKHIANIKKVFLTPFVEVGGKTKFDVNKIGDYLMQMMPNLKLPPNYTLKIKPEYLKSSKRISVTPSQSNRKRSKDNSSVLIKTLPQVRVILENCDHLLIEAKREIDDGQLSAAGTEVFNIDVEMYNIPDPIEYTSDFTIQRVSESLNSITGYAENGTTNPCKEIATNVPIVASQLTVNDGIQNVGQQKAGAAAIKEFATDRRHAIVKHPRRWQNRVNVQRTKEDTMFDAGKVLAHDHPMVQANKSNEMTVVPWLNLNSSQETTKKNYEHIQMVQNELTMKTKAFEELTFQTNATIAALRSQVAHLLGKVNEKQMEIDNFKKQHEIELQNRIDETKSKSWCIICKNEAVSTFGLNPAFCQLKCVEIYW